MLASPDRLETHEGNLHGHEQSYDVEHGVTDKQSLGEPSHYQEQEHV